MSGPIETKRRSLPGWRRVLRWLLLAAAGLAVAWTAWYFYTAYAVQRAQKGLRQARAASTHLPGLVEAAEIPASDNAATLYMQAFILMSHDRPESIYKPGTGSQASPIWDAYVDALQALAKGIDGDIAAPPPAELTRVLDLLHQAGRRPLCRFPLAWDGAATVLPEVIFVRQAQVLLLGSTTRALASGDQGQAGRHLTAAVALARHYRQHAVTLIELLMGAMVDQAVCNWAQAQSPLPASLRDSLADSLTRPPERLRAQLLQVLWFGEYSRNFAFEIQGSLAGQRNREWPFLHPLVRPWLLQQQAAIVDWYRQVLAGVEAASMIEPMHLPPPPDGPLANLFCSKVQSLTRQLQKIDACCRATIAACRWQNPQLSPEARQQLRDHIAADPWLSQAGRDADQRLIVADPDPSSLPSSGQHIDPWHIPLGASAAAGF